MLVAVGWLGARVDPWLGALFVLALWAGATGALHPGHGPGAASDPLDSSEFYRSPASRQEALHAGAIGVVATFMELFAKLVLLMVLVRAEIWLGLGLIPAWAGWCVLVWRRTGHNTRFPGEVTSTCLLVWTCLLAMASVLSGAAVLLAAMPLAWLWRGRRAWQTGSLEGGVPQARIALVETMLMISLLLADKYAEIGSI